LTRKLYERRWSRIDILDGSLNFFVITLQTL
jgi:hypothetical protein